MAITTYLFDLDDTLIDAQIYAKIYPFIISGIKSKFKLTDKLLDEEMQQLGLKKNKYNRWDTGDICRALGMLDFYYQELEKAIQVNSWVNLDAQALFSTLKQRGKKIGIVSNSMSRTIYAYLHKYGLSEMVDFIVSAVELNKRKSDEVFWRDLISSHKLIPKETVVIGDDLQEDVNLPKKFGFQTFHMVRAEDLKRIAGLFP
ncbi:MAG: HAD family hydrolase [Candidatus Woesearchaeota archaeon]|jgi:FMN phosphatase YigB (HAD superfamily)